MPARDVELRGKCRALARATRRLHERGLVAGAEGNLSVRLQDGSILITPSGVDKAELRAPAIVRVHADGTMRHALERRRRRRGRGSDSRAVASSELGMHLACYAARPDAEAVVHAHPPVATAFAAAGRPLPADVLPEVAVAVGPTALVPYGRPGTPALAERMTPFLGSHDAFLLANHGVTVIGRSLTEAVLRLESVEQSARIIALAEVLGGAVRLPAAEAAALAALSSAAR